MTDPFQTIVSRGEPGIVLLSPLAPTVSLPLAEPFAFPPERRTRFAPRRRVFSNPILPSPSADPWILQQGGLYYYCESRNQKAIYIRRSGDLIGIGADPGREVWRAPAQGLNSDELWAPELHFLNGRWYIYYAADDGRNENHRMWVLESEGEDPFGPYIDRGCLETGGWAIDGTILRLGSGELYFLWSGWPGQVNGRQNIYIAPMSDPCTISGPRVPICLPTELWETKAMAIAEGPQVLQRGGCIFVVYSASGSWTVDYCLGMLVHRGGDLLDPESWEKQGPVFTSTSEVWGVGHCSFVKSPDASEDWIVYHAKSKRKNGWEDRNVRAQPFTWHEGGRPNFGGPISAGVPIAVPSEPAFDALIAT